MRKWAFLCMAVTLVIVSHARQKPDKLTVEKIMRDPKWIGTSPSSPQWSADGKSLYFNWNPDQAPADSLYAITLAGRTPVKLGMSEKQELLTSNQLVYNTARTAYVYARQGDIFYTDIKSGKTKRITQTTEAEFGPRFSFNDAKIIYTRAQNLYAWDIATGELLQLTNIRSGEASAASAAPAGPQRGGGGGFNPPAARTATAGNQQEKWLTNDQLQYFEVLRSRKEKSEKAAAYNKAAAQKELRSIALDGKSLTGLSISPDGRFISYNLIKQATGNKSTIVPNYVTESGFTTDIPARTKVGAAQNTSEFFMYDRLQDTIYTIKADSIPGIRDLPGYVKDYPKTEEELKKKNAPRPVSFLAPYWSPGSSRVMLDIRSGDNKDRWLMQWDTATRKMSLISRQRDEAWIGGPGIFGSTGWISDEVCWYQSEETGYSHLYTFHTGTKEKKALTAGNYEVLRAQLSNDKKQFFITTNEVHPGEQHFYKLTISNGKKERITTATGASQVTVSPDEKTLAVLYSYSTEPWELFVQENKPGGKREQITSKAKSDEFKSYSWRDPEVITFTARDGASVYARLYKPANPHPDKPAVFFIHGAGYLQNAHKWWSNYFREYMFNNMLADNGYYVLDIDYRGSAGYGRDWRTGIYRHMGGKDLTDHIDAIDYLAKNYGVSPANIGLYGGSYGGFLTLMGMFTAADKFKAGAALRPVTDWAQYNHGYTSNILNEPFNDSLAYRKSSPLYFAEGLKGDLLICHGMVDVNVHYQDAVKLTQRLIELGKDNWELASYPMEDHGFAEPSSWTDEYKRIYKLFETSLKKKP